MKWEKINTEKLELRVKIKKNPKTELELVASQEGFAYGYVSVVNE